MRVVSAQDGESLAHFITLSQEYVTWMMAEIQKIYPEIDVSVFAADHDYDDIHKKYPGDHVPPHGCLRIAVNDTQVAGCVALGRLTETVCEMRTLFVRPAFRGMGVGKKLVVASLAEAQNLGYRRIRLDTLGFMQSARQLYQSYGFHEIAPYRNVPDALKSYIHFLELSLVE